MGKAKFRIVHYCIAFSILVTSGVACSKAGLSSITTTTLQSSTYVELMNLAPFAPSTQIYLNGIQSTSAVIPGSYLTTYEHLTPNQYDVKFQVAGSDSVLADIPVSAYDSGAFYTLILYNVDTVHKATNAIKITDDFSNVTGSYAYLRVIDMCPDLSSVDVYVNNQLYQMGRSNADIVVTGPQYTSFQPVAAGNFSIGVTLSGKTTQIYQLDNGLLEAGNAYTILLDGSKSNPNYPINLHLVDAAY